MPTPFISLVLLFLAFAVLWISHHLGDAVGSPALATVCCLFGLLSGAFGGTRSSSSSSSSSRGALHSRDSHLSGNRPSAQKLSTPSHTHSVEAAQRHGEARRSVLRESVQQLRELLGPTCEIGEERAVRFIAANKGNIDKAARQYRDFLDWRARERVDDVLHEAPYPSKVQEVLDRGYDPVLLDGYDLHGRPVMLIRVGGLDVPALRNLGVTTAMLVRRHIKAMEELERAIDSSPDPYGGGHLLLLDIGGCTVGKFLYAYAFWREIARIGQHFYPECLGGLAIIRAAGAAAWAVGKVKSVLDPETSAKIQMYYGEQTLSALRAHLPQSTRLPISASAELGPWPAEQAAVSKASGGEVTQTPLGPMQSPTWEAAASSPAHTPTSSSGGTSGPRHRRHPSYPADRRQRALERLPELRAQLELMTPPLTSGQRAWCCDATLLRYLAYNEVRNDASGVGRGVGGITSSQQSSPGAPSGPRGGGGIGGTSKPSATVQKTLSALQSTLRWRDSMGFDPDPATAPPRVCEQCAADQDSHCFFSIGHDRRGWEVIYCCPPRSRLKDPASSSMHAFKCFEAIDARAPDGRGTGKFVMAVDLHGLGFSDLNPQTALTTTSAILAHYVGQIGQVVILDAPFAFKGIWAMLSSMLDATNAARVQMLRGEAMGRYFAQHLTEDQANFMQEVLKMKAVPGSLPPTVHKLRMPLDTRCASRE